MLINKDIGNVDVDVITVYNDVTRMVKMKMIYGTCIKEPFINLVLDNEEKVTTFIGGLDEKYLDYPSGEYEGYSRDVELALREEYVIRKRVLLTLRVYRELFEQYGVPETGIDKARWLFALMTRVGFIFSEPYQYDDVVTANVEMKSHDVPRIFFTIHAGNGDPSWYTGYKASYWIQYSIDDSIDKLREEYPEMRIVEEVKLVKVAGKSHVQEKVIKTNVGRCFHSIYIVNPSNDPLNYPSEISPEKYEIFANTYKSLNLLTQQEITQ